jgi:DNA-directed RNA polymerase subunit alpha
VIPIDSIFSPVTRVKYAVEATRVGQRTDYDKLVPRSLDDGTCDAGRRPGASQLDPPQAHRALLRLRRKRDRVRRDSAATEPGEQKLKKLLNMSVNEIELSVAPRTA